MIRLIKQTFFCVLASTLLCLTTNALSDTFGGVNSLSEYQAYYYDRYSEENIESIQNKTFIPGKSFIGVDFTDSSVWFRFKLKNTPGELVNIAFEETNIDAVELFLESNKSNQRFDQIHLTRDQILSYYSWKPEIPNQEFYLRIKNKPTLNASPRIFRTDELIRYSKGRTVIVTTIVIIYLIVLGGCILFIYLNPENVFNKFILIFTFFRIFSLLFLTTPELFTFIEAQTLKTILRLSFFMDRATLFLFLSYFFKIQMGLNISQKQIISLFILYITLGGAFWIFKSTFFPLYMFAGICMFLIVNLVLYLKSFIKSKGGIKLNLPYLFLVVYVTVTHIILVLELWIFYTPEFIKHNFINLLLFMNVSALVIILLIFSSENIKEFIIKKNNLIKIQEQLRLEESQRIAQQSFMSMLLHELNTPLSIIKLGIHTAFRRGKFSTVEQARINRINSAIDDLNTIIENCVTVDKYTDNSSKAKIERVNIASFIDDLIDEFAEINPSITERIRLINNLPELSHNTVNTDPTYLRIILANLVKNSLNYSPVFSPVQIWIDALRIEGKDFIQFEVVNELPPEVTPDLDSLFTRYYRGESARKFPGTGLGLWLSQTLAHRINSLINVRLNARNIIFSLALSL